VKNALFLVLFFCVSIPARTNLHASNSAELAPKKYVYIDGNNNRYAVVQVKEGGTIDYLPITEAESSSGTYNGGEPWKITISKEDFNLLANLIKKSTKEIAQLSEERTVGCGTIILPKNNFFFLRADAANKTMIEGRFNLLKKNYLPKKDK
jgi:hypothetical protein